MASISGDELATQEIEGTRRTRSGRKTAPVPVTPIRNTRRSSRKKSSECVVELDETAELAVVETILEEVVCLDDVQEIVNNEQECIIEEVTDDQQTSPEIFVPDDKSSSFPFGTLQADLNAYAMYDQSSAGVVMDTDVQPTSTDSIDNLLANLAEDNANSLPSVADENTIHSTVDDKPVIPVDVVHDEVAESVAVEVLADEVVDEVIEEVNEAISDSSSLPAIAEDLPNGACSQETKIEDGLDAEMVSEDELPAPAQPKVDDAEEVSDEELPGPKLAELPADTEVVSEDELPSSNRVKRKVDEGYDPCSPTEDIETPEKRAKIDSETDEKEREKLTEVAEKEPEKNPLPDLDKYWKSVNDDPTDFTAWTYLLQYVDQENDIEAAREAYDAFLAHYPYCYGYWRKYSDYEKRKGNKKKCEEVFERGLKAIPLSVDLWIHYLIHVKQSHAEDEEYIRSQFERAVLACGLEFRSDKLWEAYIKWEMENKRLSNVIHVYDRLLATPTQGYNGHFDNFQEIVNNNSITSLISVDEFKRIRTEVRESETKVADDDPSIAPGEEEPDDHVRNEIEVSAIKDKVLTTRRKIQKATVAAVTARWTYEEAIKRPYFHVKPLERCQLKNWKEYLDFEIEHGDRTRVLVLFERCLIACALYDEFWLKLIRYLEAQPSEPEIVQKAREVYERACTIHHPDKPSLHLLWSAFEEQHDNTNKAADILTNLEKVCPNILQVAYRRINLERRRGDFEKCTQLYEHYIANTKSKNTSGSFAIKFARFCHKIKGDLDGGLKVLRAALEKEPGNTRVVLQMIDLALQRSVVDEKEVVQIMDNFLARENIDADQKVLFTQRKVEFLEDFGSSAKELQDAQRLLQAALSKANDTKKKTSDSPQKKTAKDNIQTPSNTAPSSSSSYNNSYYNSGNNSAYYGNSQYGAQPYGDGYGYGQWQQQYGSGYGNYGQWSGYGSSGYY